MMLAPLARNAEEAVGSMGNDTPLAVLSRRKPLIYSYFKQMFAQVTNPPIDSIREAVVMSVKASVGSERNLLDETPEHARQLVIDNPILRDSELDQLQNVDSDVFKSHTVDTTWPVEDGADGLTIALDRICLNADIALAAGTNILILSDRAAGPTRVPVPSLLATAAVHNHLVREGTRLQTGIIVESGEPRSVHSIATLIGYGAAAVNPYLMLETLAELVELGWLPDEMDAETAQARAVKGIAKGLLKTMSKMGISTIPSYCGAQIFEAVGLSEELVERHFTHTPSRIGGIGLRDLAEGSLARHARAYPGSADELLPVIGLYAWRRDGEHHQWNPDTIALLQHAVRSKEPGDVRGVLALGQRRLRAPLDAARADEVPLRGGRRHPDRGRRARGGDREAVLDRGDVARLDLARGARDARDRDEPDRRPLEHRRGRRGSCALRPRRQRRLAPLGDQAGRVRPLRRQRVLPRERRRAPDQDGAGREARRGRPAAGPQGRRLHRERAADDAGRRADLAAAASRHLFDRGSEAADLRPPLRQPVRADLGEARLRGRRRHRRRRRCEGGRRPRADLRARGRNRCVARLVDPPRRRAVGARARRDAADARAQRPPLADLGADGRAAEDRARRRRRGAARRGRDGLRDRAADRDGLRDDARLPSQHVPGRDRDAGSGAAEALRRQAGARRRVLLLRRRGSAAADGEARDRALRGSRRARRPARRRRGGVRVARARRRPLADPAAGGGSGRCAAAADARAGAEPRRRARLEARRSLARRDRRRRAGRGRARRSRTRTGRSAGSFRTR